MACTFCGSDDGLDGQMALREFWPDERAFALDACCEAGYEDNLDSLSDVIDGAAWMGAKEHQAYRRSFADWFQAETGTRPRGLVRDGSFIRLDYGLELRSIDLKTAKAFVREHHRHNKPPCSWRWGHAVYNGKDLVAVAMVGRPVARMLDHTKIVEVNRVCAASDIDGLAWNACSMLYAAAAREAKKRGFEKIITYTLESEPAITMKATGWELDALTRGGTWNRPSRARTDKAPTCRKVRWARTLRTPNSPRLARGQAELWAA